MLNLTEAGFAHWRLWAALLRDKCPRYSSDATILCRLLDMYERFGKRSAHPHSASNLTDSLRSSIEQMIGRLMTNGAPPLKRRAKLRRPAPALHSQPASKNEQG